MNERRAPSVIEVALHHYYSPEPHPKRQTPAYQFAVRELVAEEVLTLTAAQTGATGTTGSGVEITDKGKAWVEMICRTPFPVQVSCWQDPRFEKRYLLANLLEADVNM